MPIGVYIRVKNLKNTYKRPDIVGDRNPAKRLDIRKKISDALKGKPKSEEHKRKLKGKRLNTCGKNSHLWKGGRHKCIVCSKALDWKDFYCVKHRHLGWTKKQKEIRYKKTSNTMIGVMSTNIMKPGKFGNVKRGWFNINGKRLFFRSKWEANYALYLDWLKEKK